MGEHQRLVLAEREAGDPATARRHDEVVAPGQRVRGVARRGGGGDGTEDLLAIRGLGEVRRRAGLKARPHERLVAERRQQHHRGRGAVAREGPDDVDARPGQAP